MVSLGLTDLINQPDLDVNQIIQQSQLEESLFFLPSGQVPPDPSKLLASAKMQHVMEELQSQFELVIYDTTILNGFPDARLLAAATNGLVLVTGLGKLKRSMLEETMENLKVSRTPVLGMVVNGDKNLSWNLYN
jgi:Mrp family chromosome partitioning ATPase